jgi:trigger factor
MDYAGFDEAGAPLPQTQGQGYTVELGSKSLIPGFEEGLVGVKVGETREVPVEFPKDYSFEALRGKKAKFTVNVKDIKSRKLPDMTAEWLKEVGGDGTDTVEQLKNKIRQDMEHHHVKHFEEDVRAALRRELVKENTFFAPPSLVQMQYDSLVENLKQRLERERMGPAQVEDILKKNEKDLRDAADHQVRASLIIHEICRQENLTVTEQDVEDGLKKWAQTADTNIERVRELARREGWLDSMRQELLDEKVYGFLKAHATIDEKVVSAREHHH